MELVAPPLLTLLFDPQTSGGLLAAVDARVADQAAAAFTAAGVKAARIGTVEQSSGAAIELH